MINRRHLLPRATLFSQVQTHLGEAHSTASGPISDFLELTGSSPHLLPCPLSTTAPLQVQTHLGEAHSTASGPISDFLDMTWRHSAASNNSSGGNGGATGFAERAYQASHSSLQQLGQQGQQQRVPIWGAARLQGWGSTSSSAAASGSHTGNADAGGVTGSGGNDPKVSGGGLRRMRTLLQSVPEPDGEWQPGECQSFDSHMMAWEEQQGQRSSPTSSNGSGALAQGRGQAKGTGQGEVRRPPAPPSAPVPPPPAPPLPCSVGRPVTALTGVVEQPGLMDSPFLTNPPQLSPEQSPQLSPEHSPQPTPGQSPQLSPQRQSPHHSPQQQFPHQSTQLSLHPSQPPASPLPACIPASRDTSALDGAWQALLEHRPSPGMGARGPFGSGGLLGSGLLGTVQGLGSGAEDRTDASLDTVSHPSASSNPADLVGLMHFSRLQSQLTSPLLTSESNSNAGGGVGVGGGGVQGQQPHHPQPQNHALLHRLSQASLASHFTDDSLAGVGYGGPGAAGPTGLGPGAARTTLQHAAMGTGASGGPDGRARLSPMPAGGAPRAAARLSLSKTISAKGEGHVSVGKGQGMEVADDEWRVWV